MPVTCISLSTMKAHILATREVVEMVLRLPHACRIGTPYATHNAASSIAIAARLQVRPQPVTPFCQVQQPSDQDHPRADQNLYESLRISPKCEFS